MKQFALAVAVAVSSAVTPVMAELKTADGEKVTFGTRGPNPNKVDYLRVGEVVVDSRAMVAGCIAVNTALDGCLAENMGEHEAFGHLTPTELKDGALAAALILDRAGGSAADPNLLATSPGWIFAIDSVTKTVFASLVVGKMRVNANPNRNRGVVPGGGSDPLVPIAPPIAPTLPTPTPAPAEGGVGVLEVEVDPVTPPAVTPPVVPIPVTPPTVEITPLPLPVEIQPSKALSRDTKWLMGIFAVAVLILAALWWNGRRIPTPPTVVPAAKAARG